MTGATVFRVIVSVGDIEQATCFYEELFQTSGRRVSSGRHYFDTGQVIFACHDPEAEGDETPFMPNPEPIYFSVPDVDGLFGLLSTRGMIGSKVEIKTQPWGERSFYMQDPFGNPLCFVQDSTRFTGEVEEKKQELPVS